MSDIAPSTPDAQTIEFWVRLFSYINIGILFLAAFIAVALYIVSDKLQKAKEAELEVYKKGADERIAKADSEAAKAKSRAEEAGAEIVKANARIEEAKAATEKAREEVARLNKQAEELRADAEQARANIAAAQAAASRADQAAAQANLRAEQEAVRRLQLQRALAPREIPEVRARNGDNLAPLRQYQGTRVMFEFAPDIEAARATNNIAAILGEAGWEILGANPSQELAGAFWDGVVVETPTGARSVGDVANEAADTLVPFLRAYDIKARGGPTRWDALPPNTVRVKVGMKPFPRVTQDDEREILTDRDRDEQRREMEYRELYRRVLEEFEEPWRRWRELYRK